MHPCLSVAKRIFIRCNCESLASDYHGLTRNIIKSVNFCTCPLQKIPIRCSKVFSVGLSRTDTEYYKIREYPCSSIAKNIHPLQKEYLSVAKTTYKSVIAILLESC